MCVGVGKGRGAGVRGFGRGSHTPLLAPACSSVRWIWELARESRGRAHWDAVSPSLCLSSLLTRRLLRWPRREWQRVAESEPQRGAVMIHFFLMVNKHGQTRLADYFGPK